MAAVESEIRYLTPPSVDTRKKKYCRFKKSGIKYIDYKDPEFLKEVLERAGQNPSASHYRYFTEISASRGTGNQARTPDSLASICNRFDEIKKEERQYGNNTERRYNRLRLQE